MSAKLQTSDFHPEGRCLKPKRKVNVDLTLVTLSYREKIYSKQFLFILDSEIVVVVTFRC